MKNIKKTFYYTNIKKKNYLKKWKKQNLQSQYLNVQYV